MYCTIPGCISQGSVCLVESYSGSTNVDGQYTWDLSFFLNFFSVDTEMQMYVGILNTGYERAMFVQTFECCRDCLPMALSLYMMDTLHSLKFCFYVILIGLKVLHVSSCSE
jgi:hypothetical protein